MSTNLLQRPDVMCVDCDIYGCFRDYAQCAIATPEALPSLSACFTLIFVALVVKPLSF